jgi:hypothetical protein
MIGRVSGALPGRGKARSKAAASPAGAKRAGQVGGFAVLTAVAGLAFKNRDKIASKLSRGESAEDHAHGAPGMTDRSGTRVGTTSVP